MTKEQAILDAKIANDHAHEELQKQYELLKSFVIAQGLASEANKYLAKFNRKL